MSRKLTCPSCGFPDLNLLEYDSMMVLRPDWALFSVRCSRCSAKISSLQPIPEALREEVRFAAIEVGAGMGLE